MSLPIKAFLLIASVIAVQLATASQQAYASTFAPSFDVTLSDQAKFAHPVMTIGVSRSAGDLRVEPLAVSLPPSMKVDADSVPTSQRCFLITTTEPPECRPGAVVIGSVSADIDVRNRQTGQSICQKYGGRCPTRGKVYVSNAPQGIMPNSNIVTLRVMTETTADNGVYVRWMIDVYVTTSTPRIVPAQNVTGSATLPINTDRMTGLPSGYDIDIKTFAFTVDGSTSSSGHYALTNPDCGSARFSFKADSEQVGGTRLSYTADKSILITGCTADQPGKECTGQASCNKTRVRIKLSPKRVAGNGERMRIKGRIRSSATIKNRPVRIQYLSRGRSVWRTIRELRSNARGRFTAVHKFRRLAASASGKVKFRAIVADSDSWETFTKSNNVTLVIGAH